MSVFNNVYQPCSYRKRMNISNPTPPHPWCHHPQLNMKYAGTGDDKERMDWDCLIGEDIIVE